MIMSPPTDRLHKFLAITGMALVAASVSLPLQRYQDAELQRIDAEEKLQQAGYALERFGDSIKKQLPIANEAIKRLPSAEAAQPFIDRLNKLAVDTEKAALEAQGALIASQKQIALAQHYRFVKIVWFGIGAVSFLVGCWLIFVGIRQWIAVPKTER